MQCSTSAPSTSGRSLTSSNRVHRLTGPRKSVVSNVLAGARPRSVDKSTFKDELDQPPPACTYPVPARSDLTAEYVAIDSSPLNKLVMALFRNKMVAALGQDTPMQGYDGIIDLTRKLNYESSSPRKTQLQTVAILVSLFPTWLLPLFKTFFAGPFPAISAQLNAWVTSLTCRWLMGPQAVNDVEIDGGKIGKGHGVLVERCRYLEASGCTSVCVNSCKVPTQEFFAKHMGVPLMMEPNFEDFSCQYSFGRTPPPQAEDPAFSGPCLAICPTGDKAAMTSSRCHKVVVDAR